MDAAVHVAVPPSPGLHIGVALFNVLPTGCVTLERGGWVACSADERSCWACGSVLEVCLSGVQVAEKKKTWLFYSHG